MYTQIDMYVQSHPHGHTHTRRVGMPLRVYTHDRHTSNTDNTQTHTLGTFTHMSTHNHTGHTRGDTDTYPTDTDR